MLGLGRFGAVYLLLIAEKEADLRECAQLRVEGIQAGWKMLRDYRCILFECFGGLTVEV